MKKLAFISVFCMLGLASFAQDTAKTKQHLNEFGIDATGFLRQYLNIGNYTQYPEYYNPTYYLTYRRHFSCGNLRVAIGGDFYNDQIPSANYPNIDSANKYYDKGNSFYAAIGWEFYNNLSKRWQVFYGIDLRTTLTFEKNELESEDGEYTSGYDSRTQIYGVAPLLGIRFQLTKRLSILTETSYSINTETDYSDNFYTPLPGAFQPPPKSTSQKTTKTYSSYYQPLEVFIDFTI